MEERVKTEFLPYDLIFAKMKSFPPWPAKVLDRANYPETPAQKVPVVFYGTHELGFMRPQEIYDYIEFRERFGVQKKLKGFNEGLAEAEAELIEVNTPATVKEEVLPEAIAEPPILVEQEKVSDSSKRARKPPKALGDFIQSNSARKRKAPQQSPAGTPKVSRIVEELSTPGPSTLNDSSLSFAIDHMKDETEPGVNSSLFSLHGVEKPLDVVPKSHKKSKPTKIIEDVSITNDIPQEEEMSMSYTIEQLKDELESFEALPQLSVVSNEIDTELAPKSAKKGKSKVSSKTQEPRTDVNPKNEFESVFSSDQHFAHLVSPEAEIQHQSAPTSIFTTTILSEKRIRKKKTFSDDFVSPDFIFGTPKLKTPSSVKHKKAPAIVESSESESVDEPKNLIIDESPSPLPAYPPVLTVEQPTVAKVAPLKIKLPLLGSKKASKHKIHIIKSPPTEAFESDSDVFEGKNGKEISFGKSSSYAKDAPALTVASTSPSFNQRSTSRNDAAPILTPISTKPKKIKPVLKIALQLKSAKSKPKTTSLAKLIRPKLAPFKTSSKIKWQEGETEAEYKRRRRIQNRMSKQNYKMKKLFVTAYSYWSGIEMEKLMKEQPDLMDFQEIRLVLQTKWRALSNEEKDKFRILAKQEKQKRIASRDSGQPLDVLKPADLKEKLLVDEPVKEEKSDENEPKHLFEKEKNGSKSYFEKTKSPPKNLFEKFSKPGTSKMSSPRVADLPEALPITPVKQPAPKRKLDPDTKDVIVRRTAVGPVEARSRWWLYSNTGNPGRRRGRHKESSPLRGLTAELLDNVAIFRLMARSFEQMGNRLLKLSESSNMATGAMVDSLLDGFLLTTVQLLTMTRGIHPSSLCFPKDSVMDLVEKTAFLTPL